MAPLANAQQDALVLAVHEAVANGMQHGDGDTPVVVEADVRNGDLVVEITTRGAWATEREREGLFDAGGRGLTLMRGLVNRVEIVGDGDSVTLRLRMDSPPAGQARRQDGSSFGQA